METHVSYLPLQGYIWSSVKFLAVIIIPCVVNGIKGR
jgi:hypothetical protein